MNQLVESVALSAALGWDKRIKKQYQHHTQSMNWLHYRDVRVSWYYGICNLISERLVELLNI